MKLLFETKEDMLHNILYFDTFCAMFGEKISNFGKLGKNNFMYKCP